MNKIIRKNELSVPNTGISPTHCFAQSYEKRMIEYMQAVPHIPPTLFELKLRHDYIKSDTIKQFKNTVNDNNAKQLISKLDNQLELIYTKLVEKNIIEYKTCQTAFIIGWKGKKNIPNVKIEEIDDRF